MGYTHYWRRRREFGRAAFEHVRADVARAVPILAELGVGLAGPIGDGEPVLSVDEIAFNGVRGCDHAQRDLGITWPAADAGGVCLAYQQSASGDNDVSGSWFAGRRVRQRTCGGDCSHESFWLPRVRAVRDWETAEQGLLFDFCKTAYKPYDVAVQVCLIIAAHHFGAAIVVSSDGSLEDWQDAIALCQEVLGYGSAFRLAE